MVKAKLIQVGRKARLLKDSRTNGGAVRLPAVRRNRRCCVAFLFPELMHDVHVRHVLLLHAQLLACFAHAQVICSKTSNRSAESFGDRLTPRSIELCECHLFPA